MYNCGGACVYNCSSCRCCLRSIENSLFISFLLLKNTNISRRKRVDSIISSREEIHNLVPCHPHVSAQTQMARKPSHLPQPKEEGPELRGGRVEELLPMPMPIVSSRNRPKIPRRTIQIPAQDQVLGDLAKLARRPTDNWGYAAYL